MFTLSFHPHEQIMKQVLFYLHYAVIKVNMFNVGKGHLCTD
jgi:hypothetical protein